MVLLDCRLCQTFLLNCVNSKNDLQIDGRGRFVFRQPRRPGRTLLTTSGQSHSFSFPAATNLADSCMIAWRIRSLVSIKSMNAQKRIVYFVLLPVPSRSHCASTVLSNWFPFLYFLPTKKSDFTAFSLWHAIHVQDKRHISAFPCKNTRGGQNGGKEGDNLKAILLTGTRTMDWPVIVKCVRATS